MADYQEIQSKIDTERKNGAFVFMPSPILSMEDSFYKPVAETVFLREDEVYSAQKKFRIHYNGLLRLAAAASFEWSAIDTCRTDGRTDKMYCSFRAVGGVRKADGKVYFHKAEKDIDLEVLEMELEDKYLTDWDRVKDCKGNDAWKKHGHNSKDTFIHAMVRRDMIQKRKNKLTLVESGAKARVIRFVLGLQSQYSNKNQVIGMPFVMVSYSPNIQHPDVKRVLTNNLPESMSMIYGGVKDTGQIPYLDPDQSSPDVIDVTPEKGDTQQDTVNIFDINDISGFQGLTPKDQESWLKHYAAILKFDWGFCIQELGGKSVADAAQGWRDGFFEHVQKCSK